MITPKQVFDLYPDNDLLSFEPPREGESYQDYKDRLGPEWEQLSEDRLFQFILAEVCAEELEPGEVESRLARARDDIECVIEGLARTG